MTARKTPTPPSQAGECAFPPIHGSASETPDDARHLLERGCRAVAGESGTPLMRQELKRLMQFTAPLGLYFLSQAKMLWLDSRRDVMPYLPNHDCMADGAQCRRVRVTIRVFVRNPATEENVRAAHLCLWDHARRMWLCTCPQDGEVHRRELAAVDHDELYFCGLTGRVHVCGQGVCSLARIDMRRCDEYQAVCPITGLVASDQLNVTVGSEFWKAGQEVGSSSDRRDEAEHLRFSTSADDLSRLMRKHAPRTADELHAISTSPKQQQQQQKKKASSKGRELERYIAARNEATFMHRKKFESPLWLEWAQKFAEWDLWLDVLLGMDTFQKVSQHLKDITQENYRKVWRLDGLVRRYAAAVVYAAFCPERYTNERRLMSDEVAHSIRRISDGRHQASKGPVIFSQLADATLGSITRTRHGQAFTDSALATVQPSTGSGSGGGELISLKTGEVVQSMPGRNDELRARVAHLSQRVLHLWTIMNESCQGQGLLAAPLQQSLECFPLAHFVFPALDCLADGLCVTAETGAVPMYAIPPDPDVRRQLPKSWECIGAGIYDHSYSKLVHSNCIYAVTSAMQSGRMPRDYLVTYQRQWDDVQLERQPWIAALPNKTIFRPAPKKLLLNNVHH